MIKMTKFTVLYTGRNMGSLFFLETSPLSVLCSMISSHCVVLTSFLVIFQNLKIQENFSFVEMSNESSYALYLGYTNVDILTYFPVIFFSFTSHVGISTRFVPKYFNAYFFKNKDIILCNYSTIIKIRTFPWLLHYYLPILLKFHQLL